MVPSEVAATGIAFALACAKAKSGVFDPTPVAGAVALEALAGGNGELGTVSSRSTAAETPPKMLDGFPAQIVYW